MRIAIDAKTQKWLMDRGGQVTVLPPRPSVG